MKTNLRLRKTHYIQAHFDSSAIVFMSYEIRDKKLSLAIKKKLTDGPFAHKNNYRYEDVPATIVFGLINSRSKGRYYNRFIKNKFEYTKVG